MESTKVTTIVALLSSINRKLGNIGSKLNRISGYQESEKDLAYSLLEDIKNYVSRNTTTDDDYDSDEEYDDDYSEQSCYSDEYDDENEDDEVYEDLDDEDKKDSSDTERLTELTINVMNTVLDYLNDRGFVK